MTARAIVGAPRTFRRRASAVAGLAVATVVALLLANAVAPYLFRRTTLMSEVGAQLRATMGIAVTGRHARFDLLPLPRLRLDGVRASDPSGSLAIDAERAEGAVRLLPLLVGRIELAAVHLEKPRVSLDLGGQRAAPDGLLARAIQRLASRGGEGDRRLGTLTFADGTLNVTEGARQLLPPLAVTAATLDWRSLDAPLTLDAALAAGGVAVDLAAWVADPAGLARRDHSAMALRLRSAPLDLSANGDLATAARSTFRGRVVAAAPSGAALAALLWPNLALPAAFANASLDGGAVASVDRDGTATLDLGDLTLRADGNAFEGTLAVVGGARPLVSGTLATARLSLAPFLAAAPAMRDAARGWNEAPVSIPQTGAVDLDLRFSASRLRAGAITLEDAALSVLTRNARVEVGLNEGKAYGGRVKGRVSVGTAADGVSLRAAGTLTGADLAGLSWDAFGRQLATGTLSASANLESSGDSVAALSRRLQGWVRAEAAEGELSSVDLARSLRNAAPGAAPVLRAGRTPFASVTLGARLADGSATLDEGAMRAPDASTLLSGTVDVGARLLDLRAALRGPDLPERRVAIGGGFDEVTVAPDGPAAAP